LVLSSIVMTGLRLGNNIFKAPQTVNCAQPHVLKGRGPMACPALKSPSQHALGVPNETPGPQRVKKTSQAAAR
jgi:hypothetical protein